MNVVAGDGVRVFGQRDASETYTRRRAAYVVMFDDRGNLALVLPPELARFFLIGGGCEEGESAEACVVREAREETGAEIGVVREIGEARQFFSADGIDYEMEATFFEGRLLSEPEGGGEYDLLWVPPPVAIPQMFHECHAWAISQTVRERQ